MSFVEVMESDLIIHKTSELHKIKKYVELYKKYIKNHNLIN